MTREELKLIIWKTKMCRTRAEERLKKKNQYLQFINIYYSCSTTYFSIWAHIKKNEGLGMMSIFISIALLIGIIYLNSLKYEEQAKEYKKDYIAMHYLEVELENENLSDNEVLNIYKKYVDILNNNNNHIPYDYYCVIRDSNTEIKKLKWKEIKKNYHLCRLYRFIIKSFLFLLPVIAAFLSKVLW